MRHAGREGKEEMEENEAGSGLDEREDEKRCGRRVWGRWQQRKIAPEEDDGNKGKKC